MVKYIDNDELTAVGESVVGQVRAANEDSCGYQSTPNGELFVVCDGMGGHVGGAVASQTAVSCIITTLTEHKYDNIPVALYNALVDANHAVYHKGRMDQSLSGMGTTACILMVKDGQAWIAHVGDSRIYLYTAKDKTLHRITKDHSYVQSLVDLGELDDREAENHPRKNVILKALGIKEDLKIDIVQMPVLPCDGDVFLICSDGLSGMVDDNCIESILASHTNIEAALQLLIDDANAPGKGTDNITAQLIKIKGVNREYSEFVDFNPLWRRQVVGAMPTMDFTDSSPSEVPVKRKKNRLWLWICLGIVGLFIVAGVSALSYRALKDRKDDLGLTKKIKQLEGEIESLGNKIIDKQSEITEDSTELAKDGKVLNWKGDTTGNKGSRDSRLKANRDTLAILKDELKDRKSELDQLQQQKTSGKEKPTESDKKSDQETDKKTTTDKNQHSDKTDGAKSGNKSGSKGILESLQELGKTISI